MEGKDKSLFYKVLKKETRRFCTNTGLHGYKYIAQVDKTVFTRFAWTLILLVASIYAVNLVYTNYNVYRENPTKIITDSTHNAIWNYLFPAVTICNINKMSLKETKEFINKLELPPDLKTTNLLQSFIHLIQLVYFNYAESNEEHYRIIQRVLDYNNVTVDDALYETHPPCHELLSSCFWKGRILRYDSLFQKLKTPDGICCSTNFYGLKNKKFTGYMPERYKTKPRKMSACGYKSGLKILINIDTDDYLISEFSVYGAKVIIHDPLSYPEWSTPSILIPIHTFNYLSITPTATYGSEELQQMKVKDRLCLFSSEKSLKLYTNYTYSNCLTQCRMEFIQNVCNCTPYYFVNTPVNANNENRTCNMTDIECVSKYKHLYMSSTPGLVSTKVPNSINYLNCDCLPDCESREYLTAVSRSSTFKRNLFVYDAYFTTDVTDKNNSEKSFVNIFFKDIKSKRNKMDKNCVWYVELAFYGGLLGLCLGFSFISIIEIIYFFVIKTMIDYSSKKKAVNSTSNTVKVKAANGKGILERRY